MPEDTDFLQEQNHETQIAELRTQLTGHKIFARRRGESGKLAGLLRYIMDNTKTPSEAKRLWQDLVGDGSVLLMLMAQLDREGHTEARKQMLSALTSSNFVFTGEEVPLSETTAITVIMPDPVRTLMPLRWIMRIDSVDNFFRHIEHCEDSEQHYRPEEWLNKETLELIRAFHSILGRFNKHYNGPGSINADGVLMSSHAMDVLSRFNLHEGTALVVDPNRQYSKGVCYVPGNFLESFDPGYRNRVTAGHLAFLVCGEQKDVISRFERKHQSLIATWQLRIPTSVWLPAKQRFDNGTERFRASHIEIFAESEHKLHLRQNPSFTSKGVSNRVGVRWVTTHDRNSIYPGCLNKNEPFRCLLCS
ncbi:MAG: hypothetical protein ABIH67_01680 [Candidatus Uhrbacteria bacterium]